MADPTHDFDDRPSPAMLLELWGEIARVNASLGEGDSHPYIWLHDHVPTLLEQGSEDGAELAALLATEPATVWRAVMQSEPPIDHQPCPFSAGLGPSYVDMGRWYRHMTGRQTYQEINEAEEEQQRRITEYRKRVRDEHSRAADKGNSKAARVLAMDEDARRSMAHHLGAKIIGGVARRIICPSCGHPSVWFSLARGWAHCNHLESCTWAGSVHTLARLSGGVS